MKEIMDLMQADPAFDVLFSCFGLGNLHFTSHILLLIYSPKFLFPQSTCSSYLSAISNNFF